jgi:UPF0755 protein
MKWLFRLVAVLVLLGAAAVAAHLGFDAYLQAPGPAPESVVVVLPKGTGTQDIGNLLAKSGVIGQPAVWPVVVRLSSRQALQAGEYEFPPHASLAAILDMIRHGQVVVHKLTIAEGLTVQQIEAILREASGAAGKLAATPVEGSLLPSTYFYTYGQERQDLVGRMQRGMAEALDDAWAKRDADVPFASKDEALVMASVVERETGIAEERPHVAAVFENRLRLHMRLQSDPTVIYVLSHGQGVMDRPLTHADLATPSPYNTYASDGLPPAPICNPGRASIQAVLHPLASEDLYFVADGSGGHAFARSLADHNKNVARLRKLEQAK